MLENRTALLEVDTQRVYIGGVRRACYRSHWNAPAPQPFTPPMQMAARLMVTIKESPVENFTQNDTVPMPLD